MNEIKQAIKQMVGKGNYKSSELFVATVKSVEWGDLSCTVTTDDGREMDEVRLRAVLDGNTTGVILKPKVGSDVLVGTIDGSEEVLVIVMFSDVDGIYWELNGFTMSLENGVLTFNDGDKNGLVILNQLVNNLNQIKSYLNALKTATSTAIGATAATGSAAAQAAFDTAMGTQSINFVDMENTAIKQ